MKDGCHLQFIGTVHSALKTLDECPLLENENAPGAAIVILPEFLEGIRHLRPGTAVVLLTWLHHADRKVLQCRPRNNPVATMTGVFSTRSPDRPNPIGLHCTKVTSVSGNSITVSELEVIDGTPLIDIKPAL